MWYNFLKIIVPTSERGKLKGELKEKIVMPKYKRVVLKLSGEALMRDGEHGIIDFDFVDSIAKQIKKCTSEGVSFGIIIGGGNIWRGAGKKINRSRADHMGMLATVINCLQYSRCSRKTESKPAP